MTLVTYSTRMPRVNSRLTRSGRTQKATALAALVVHGRHHALRPPPPQDFCFQKNETNCYRWRKWCNHNHLRLLASFRNLARIATRQGGNGPEIHVLSLRLRLLPPWDEEDCPRAIVRRGWGGPSGDVDRRKQLDSLYLRPFRPQGWLNFPCRFLLHPAAACRRRRRGVVTPCR